MLTNSHNCISIHNTVMRIKIDYHSGEPVYKQIVREFIKAMGRGDFTDGSSIPSVRDLASLLSVNPNTVAKAYRELEREGFIYSRPGIGMFIKLSKEKVREIALSEFKENIKKDIDLALSHGISLNDCKEVMCKLLKEVENEENSKDKRSL